MFLPLSNSDEVPSGVDSHITVAVQPQISATGMTLKDADTVGEVVGEGVEGEGGHEAVAIVARTNNNLSKVRIQSHSLLQD